MKLRSFILLITAVIYQHAALKSQIELPYEQGFELGATPPGWSEEPDEHLEPWKYRNGGHNPEDLQWVSPDLEEDIANNPPSAHSGISNAIFFLQSEENEKTKLVTPELDLEGGTRIELSFYLCQIPWIFEGSGTNDVLRVYYRKHADSSWVLLHEYLDPIYDWELQTLVLPNLTSTYYVAFEGHTRYGYGTCLDDVVIEEKGIRHVWIGELEFQQQFVNYIPSGSNDIPMMRIDFKVFGNDDTAKLEQIHFTSLNDSDEDIAPGGVKLYSTETQVFSTDNPIGTPTDFNVSGIASFTGLNYSLPRGQSYVWLAYDVDPAAVHGDTLDAMVAANGILANDTLYPASGQSPDGYRTVYETQFFEDFEGSHSFTLTGEFEVGTPSGGGGSNGNPDPAEAFSGTKVLGTDLTGIAPYPYDYEPNLSESTSYLATSTTYDVFYYKNLNLFFYRYLNIDVNDEAYIQVSSDSGSTWHTVWESGESFVSDYEWQLAQVEIPDLYSRTDRFRFRFKLGPTDAAKNYSGWNIDDLYLTGEFISKDVGVSEWIYPLSGSGHTASDSVTVRITNYGGAVITDPVPVAYSFNGGITWTHDDMTQSIPIGGSVDFTFPTKVDLSVPGLYPSVIARTNLPGDQYTPNDSLATQVYIVPTYTPPHTENFESNDGYWRSSGNGIWEYGMPSGTVIDSASSGIKSWATGLSQQYDDLISQKNITIFADDFEDDRGWSLTGQFERAQPSTIHPPYYPISPYYCLGTDLTGLPDSLYKYENGITEGSAYAATSPALDVSAYSNLNVNFPDNINIRAGDSIRLEVSPDNGANWYTLWKNTEGEILNDYEWVYQQYPIHDSLSYSTELKIRFSLFHSSLSGPVAEGWNIDNFDLRGDLVNSSPAYLTSPSYNLSGIEKPVFEARLWWDTEPDVDGTTLLYSLDDGDTWTPVSDTSDYDAYWNWYTGNPVSELGLDGWSGQSGGWLTVKHLLPSAVINEDNVQFRFQFQADKVNNEYDGFALDDIHISEAPGDLGVLAIIEPSSACDLSSNETFNLRIKNYGIMDLETGDTIRVGYYIEREGEVQTDEETIVLTQPFDAGTDQYFDMATEFDFSKSGDYNLAAYTIEVDPYYYQSVANDTANKLVSVRKPAVELGPDISTVRPDTVVLEAFSGVGGLEYLWQDLSTDSVFHVSTAGKYYVRVTNEIPCVASDTIRIYQLIADAGVTDLLAPVSDCELGPAETPTILIKNFGTDTLGIGYEIPVYYRLDQGAWIDETAVLTEKVYPDSSFQYTFSTGSDMSAVKSYTITAYTDLLYDVTTSNDTLEAAVEAYGYTPIDLGPDTVVRALQYTIDAGPGYDSYLWQDESTSRTLLVDTTGQYKVTVKAGMQCENSDSIIVTLVQPDIAVQRLHYPVDACGYSAAENVEFYIINSGTDTLFTSDTIPISYQLDADPPVYDTMLVYKRVEPGDSILFSSSGTVDVSAAATYQFTVSASYGLDMDPGNDAFIQSVEVYGYPEVYLGADRVVNATSDTLDAGSGFAAYLWHNGSTGQQYVVEYENQTPDSTYSVTVTDDNGCQAIDEVKIGFDLWDLGITGITSPVTACRLTDAEILRVIIKNTGTQIIQGDQVRINASFDGGVPRTWQKTLTLPLNPGDSLEAIFGLAFDLSAEGDHHLTAYFLDLTKDAIPGNDTLEMVVSHMGEPKPDLGGVNDTLPVKFPYELNAGADYETYVWNGISGSRTYMATEEGWYILEVTNLGCSGKDSVYLVLSTGTHVPGMAEDLKVYPNPASGRIYIEYRIPSNDRYFLNLFDVLGRKILVREYKHVNEIRESIDVSGLAKGSYYLLLWSGKHQIVRQIIIE